MSDELADEVAECFKGFVWANNITPSVARMLIGAVVDRMRENNLRDDEIRRAFVDGLWCR